MYEHLFPFFGLRRNPFHVSPDASSYFSSQKHTSLFSELIAGIEDRRGLFVLTGEPGTGKTMLLHQLLDWMQTRRQSSCYIFHSQLKPLELLELILQDFGVPCSSRDKREMLMALNRWLMERRRMNDAPTLIIDEAQGISLRTLARLNTLLNLETNGSKLLQIVLAGQPELNVRLSRPELWQLQQRIILRSTLEPLSQEETAEYVKLRLQNSGATDTIFPDESLRTIHLCARGVPRVVNLLCEHALLSAYSENCKMIEPDLIWRVAGQFDLDVSSHKPIGQESSMTYEQGTVVCTEKQTSNETRQTALTETLIEQTHPQFAIQAASTNKWPLNLSNSDNGEDAKVAITIDVRVETDEDSVKRERKPNGNVVTAQFSDIRALARKRFASKHLLVNWRRPSFIERWARYWYAVQRSFVDDCKQFVRTYTQSNRNTQHVGVKMTAVKSQEKSI